MPLTEMEQCIQTILKLFHESAAQEGDYDTLSKNELKGFITKNFPTYMKLDTDKNQQLSFEETMVFFTRMMIAAHDHIHRKEGHDHSH